MNKYRNKKVEVAGEKFDSLLEMRFYFGYLQPLAKAEKWTIERQKPFELVVNGQIVTKYLADFFIPETNTIWEVKGIYTEKARLKMLLAKACLDKEIIMVRSLSSFEKVLGYRKRAGKALDPDFDALEASRTSQDEG